MLLFYNKAVIQAIITADSYVAHLFVEIIRMLPLWHYSTIVMLEYCYYNGYYSYGNFSGVLWALPKEKAR